MTKKPLPPPEPTRRMRGFEVASSLMRDRIRSAGESRGFAVTRLLTHWAEVAGEDIARVTRPVKIGYGRDGLGATLTLLVQGANATLVEMQKEKLREKVNAIYGYAAISRITLTQTAPVGFAEGQAEFAPAPKAAPQADPQVTERAAETVAPIQDEGFRAALEALAQNILTRRKS